MSTPAGWYPSPEDSKSKQYWDGTAWTGTPSAVPAGAKVLGALRWVSGGSSGHWERFTGKRWAKASYSAQPQLLTSIAHLDEGTELAREKRCSMLRKAVSQEVLGGATVVQQDDLFAILAYRRPVRHGLHFLAWLLTLGTWSVVWIIMVVARKEDRVRVEIDPQGHVWSSESV